MSGFINELKNSGLQEYEAKIYFLLLTHDSLNPTEISKLSDVPRTKIYPVLKNLIKKGFCTRIPGKLKNYKALDPQVAFSEFLHKIDEKRENVKNLANELEKVYESKNTKKSLDEYIEILTSNKQIHERYLKLLKNTKHELIGFMKPPYSHEGNKKKFNTQENQYYDIAKKGIQERSLYEFPRDEERDVIISHIESCIKVGEKARLLEKIPLKMIISDGRYVLMALNNPESADSNITSILIEHPDLALANKILFEHLWDQAISFEEYKRKVLKN